MTTNHANTVAVFGSSSAKPGQAQYEQAVQVGSVLAELGYGLDDPLPQIVGGAGWSEILAALAITGDEIESHLLTDRRADTLAARARLVDRLKRAGA